MPQPDAPVKVVGCSAEERAMRDGSNVEERGSFQITDSKTVTAVRIGFAYFDALGGRQIRNAVATGTYTPGARIDLSAYAGKVGAETRRLVCFAYQAMFTDGASWTASVPPTAQLPYQPTAPPPPQRPPAQTSSIATQILPQENAPARLDRCTADGPRKGVVTIGLGLTIVSDRPIRAIDVDYVFYDASGKRTFHRDLVTGIFEANSAAGAEVRAAAAVSVETRTVAAASYAKIYCTVGRVEYADTTRLNAGKGFLAGATPP